ncbi:MAG: phage/plasmid primase, P4 family, partial [Pseudomonadota bacterium]
LFQRGENGGGPGNVVADEDPGNWGEGAAEAGGELVGQGMKVGDVSPCPALFFEISPGGRVSFKPRLLAQEILRRTPILSDPESGILYRWNGAYWEDYKEEHVRRLALRLLGDESMRARAEDAAYQVRHLATMPHGRAVNDRDGWVCVKNGLLNLSTLELVQHDPDAYCTYSLDVTFDPDLPRSVIWDRYLGQAVQLPGPIKLLQEFTGSVFMRDTRFAKCLFLLGPGSDGKSTFLKILRRLVGPANHSAVSFKDLEDKFARVALYNKLLNTGTEISEDLLESATFKAIVTGDPISARLLYGNLFEFLPTVKLAFSGNDFPRVRDNSDGFYRRILLVKFRRQFFGADDDKFLEDKLVKEMDSIFLWALAGYQRLLKNGWTECAETASLLHHERRVNDPVLAFVEDCCEFGEHLSVEKKDLYSQYQKWATANGLPYKGSPRFFEALKKSKGHLEQSRPRLGHERQYVLHGLGMANDAA